MFTFVRPQKRESKKNSTRNNNGNKNATEESDYVDGGSR